MAYAPLKSRCEVKRIPRREPSTDTASHIVSEPVLKCFKFYFNNKHISNAISTVNENVLVPLLNKYIIL